MKFTNINDQPQTDTNSLKRRSENRQNRYQLLEEKECCRGAQVRISALLRVD